MGMNDDAAKLAKTLEKIDKYLGNSKVNTEQIKKNYDGIATLTDRVARAMGTAGGSANFGPGGAGGGGGGGRTSNGMHIPTFAGIAMTAAAVGVGVANVAWSATPGLQDAYSLRNTGFSTAFATPGAINVGRTQNRIKALFSGTATGLNDPNAAAAIFTSRGLGPASGSFNRVMREAGTGSFLTGMSNPSAAIGISALQSGGGVSGRLASFGIFTNSPMSGKYNGLGGVVDQLWQRWYGSKSARVRPEKFEADLMGGFLGNDLRNLFGDQPELYEQVLAALRLKQKAGGMSNINFGAGATGANSAQAVARKHGYNPKNLPMLTSMDTTSSRIDAVAAATEPLLAGFRDASTHIQDFNKWMAEAAKTQQWFIEGLKKKGELETYMGATEAAAALGLALNGLAALIGTIVGGAGLSAAKRVLGVGGSSPKPSSTSPGGPKPNAPKPGWRVGPGGSPKPGVVTGVGAKGGVFAILAALGITMAADAWMPEGPIKDFLFGEAGEDGRNPLLDLWNGTVEAFTPPFLRAKGGYGTTTSDSINARLSKGEYVINARAAQKIGKKALDRLNGTGHAFGSGFASPAKMFNQGGEVSGTDVVNFANQFIGVPYVDSSTFEGEPTPETGWDCATFTQYVLKNFGINNAPGVSTGYLSFGKEVSRDELQPGDILVWDTASGAPGPAGHVSIYAGNGEHIHAVNRSRDTVREPISQWYWDQFASARRISKNSLSAPNGATVGYNASDGGGETSLMGNATASTSLTRSGSALLSPMSSFMKAFSSVSTMTGGRMYEGLQSVAGGSVKPAGSKGTSGSTSAAGTTNATGKQKEWASKMLTLMGAPVNKVTMEAMLTWMRYEGGHWANSADYNPLNTTQVMDGNDPSMNSVGVKVYDSWEEGFQATLNTMNSGHAGYAEMLAAFRQGDDLNAILKAIDYSSWRTGNPNEPGYNFSYASHGISNVPRDQPYNLHAGEMVLPAYQAQVFRQTLEEVMSGSRGHGGPITINLTIDKASDDEAERFARRVIQIINEDTRKDRMRNR